MRRIISVSVYLGLILTLTGMLCSAAAQTRNRKPGTTKASKTSDPVKESGPAAEPTPAPPKRNERPAVVGSPVAQNQTAVPALAQTRESIPTYRYEFSQPEFVISSIKIEHDEAGVGTISFRKKGDNEIITDPVRVSPKALSRINDALNALNFLESTENYQYEKDFSHLGNIKFSLRRGGRSRDVLFNWTENKEAKNLMNEYRKIGNQFIWIFDISLSRENQPLEAPKLFDSLDSMIRRNEISDPYQLEPFLRELANDERIPLIARNHATRLVKQFEKEKAKEEKKKSNGGG